MEVKMNKEIMEYREAMFFGLDFRQMVCSLLAVLTAVGIYFGLRGVMGDEVTGWLCMAGAAPFAFCGFFRYHGMTAEQFMWAFIKSEFLYPKKLVYKPEDIYYQCLKERISDGESGKKAKKEKKNNERVRKRITPGRRRAYRKRMKKRKQIEMKRKRQNRPELDRQQKRESNSRQKIQQKSRPDSRQRKQQKCGSDNRQRNQQKGRTDSKQKIQQKGRRIENRQKNRRDAID